MTTPGRPSAALESADRNLRIALCELDAISEELSLPDTLTDEAACICKRGLEKGLASRSQHTRVAVASLYAACREREVPTTLHDVAEASGLRKKEIASCYRMLVNELDLKIPVAHPAEYLARVASKAKASAKIQAGALEILSRAESAGVTAGRYPKGLAASALYIASALGGEKLTQKSAADAAGVTEATVRKEYKRLRSSL